MVVQICTTKKIHNERESYQNLSILWVVYLGIIKNVDGSNKYHQLEKIHIMKLWQ